jgi:hypothetical protein
MYAVAKMNAEDIVEKVLTTLGVARRWRNGPRPGT